MLKILKDLALAMLNATLLLIVLALFLALRLTDKMEHLAGGVAAHAVELLPLREEANDLAQEVTGLREDVQALLALPAQVGNALEAKLDVARDELAALSTDGVAPERLELAFSQALQSALDSQFDQEKLQSLKDRADKLETRADALAEIAASVSEAPDQIIDQSIEKAADSFAAAIIDIRNPQEKGDSGYRK